MRTQGGKVHGGFGDVERIDLLARENFLFGLIDQLICDAAGTDELVDKSKEEILASKKIDPFDVAETAVYLATLGPHTIVRQIVVDRMGADW